VRAEFSLGINYTRVGGSNSTSLTTDYTGTFLQEWVSKSNTMKRIFFNLAVSLVTFIIGVSVTGILWLYSGPDVTLPETAKFDMRSSCFPGLSVGVNKSPARTTYFPLSGLAATRFGSRGYWYSRQLKAMNELPLGALENEDESYRFLWLRTFHHPISIRVSRTGDHYFMEVKQLSGLGGYEPGTLDVNWGCAISEDEWDLFLTHLEHSNFWLMPAQGDVVSTDGAQWIMEGYRESRYHVVDRQSPAPGAYADACLYLLRQSGLLAKIPADEVY